MIENVDSNIMNQKFISTMNWDKLFDKEKIKYRILPDDSKSLINYFNKKSGWIYIAKNKNTPYLKIGRTTKSPETRAKSLSSSGVINDFEIVFSLKFLNQVIAEKHIHKALASSRVNKEFFSTPLDHAINTIVDENKKEMKMLERYFIYDLIKDDINLIDCAIKE